jgi:hypothetical protein
MKRDPGHTSGDVNVAPTPLRAPSVSCRPVRQRNKSLCVPVRSKQTCAPSSVRV